MAEEGEVKKVSKLSSLINQAKEEVNKLQITVHYSENNWETNEEINLILDENTTINQLIEATKEKLTNKENINNKIFNVRIFKKKKKIPNNEYPVCNLESKVKDYGKSHFCLVEDKQTSEPNQKEEEKVEEKKECKCHDVSDIKETVEKLLKNLKNVKNSVVEDTERIKEIVSDNKVSNSEQDYLDNINLKLTGDYSIETDDINDELRNI